jgi:hypothetical protein
MKRNRIFLALLILAILLNIASSESFAIETEGLNIVYPSLDSITNQSHNSTDLSVSTYSEGIQFVSQEVKRNPGMSHCANISNYSVIVPPNSDPADIYYPNNQESSAISEGLPFALLLQGANVDKSFYKGFACTVASYGFVVAVPNHESNFIVESGLFAEEKELNDILAFMISENATSTSPLYGKIDTGTMMLLGHSYGGVAGLYAIEGTCQPPFCFGLKFHRPASLKGGVFYGTNLKGPIGPIPELENNGIPIALIQGSRDGLAIPAEGKETFHKIENPPKAYVTIEGANHYGITDLNNPPGAKQDANVPLIPQEDAVEAIGRWSALFLRAYILGERNT